ncbi:MAG: tRNA-dihydrouridine synthase family protein [Treponema sp.]|nr:tRNA-dihydrouridine synthase family protein [Treponema sp.]
MKLICGPMATIGHPAFRIMIEQFGFCDEYYTEMINAGSLLAKGGYEKYYINPAPAPQKIVWQLTGKNSESMEESAKVLSELPGIGIDINMGCSAPDVYKYGAGIAWMIKPIDETRDMIHRVKKVLPDSKRLSVKLRLGDENFTDDGFFSFCDMLLSEGVQLLTLHPRTKKEKLSRPPRYSYCQKLADLASRRGVSLYVNGNIKDSASAAYAIKSVPSAAGLMISRAAVQKPWLFYELARDLNISESYTKEDSFKTVPASLSIDMLQIALDYIKNVQIYQPEEFWKTRLQRFFFYYSDNFKFSHYAQTQFLNASGIADLEKRIYEFFEKCPEEKIKEI